MVTSVDVKARPIEPKPPAGPGRRWKPSILAFVTAFLMLAGLVVLSYPTVASWFSQREQSKIISNYATQVNKAVPAAQQQLAEAREYNAALDAGAVLGANERIPTGSGSLGNGSLGNGSLGNGQFDYNALLSVNDSGLMGRIRIDKIDVDLPIYHGTSDAVLLKGVGHLEGTSLPVGGDSTHSVLTGHRGLADSTLFTNLNKVEVGDQFVVEVFGEVLTYQVMSTQVVDPEDTESLAVTRGKDLVTLVTCTPLGINSQRILVTGERITPTPAADLEHAGEAPDIPGFPWWAVWLSAGTIAIGTYVWWSGRPAKKSEQAPDVAA